MFPIIIWASSWDYDTYRIGDQRKLRRFCASAQSRQSLRCSHTWSMELDEGSDRKSDIYLHRMAAHASLKNEFMKDEKYHNLMRWLISKKMLQCSNETRFWRHSNTHTRDFINHWGNSGFLIFSLTAIICCDCPKYHQLRHTNTADWFLFVRIVITNYSRVLIIQRVL